MKKSYRDLENKANRGYIAATLAAPAAMGVVLALFIGTILTKII